MEWMDGIVWRDPDRDLRYFRLSPFSFLYPLFSFILVLTFGSPPFFFFPFQTSNSWLLVSTQASIHCYLGIYIRVCPGTYIHIPLFVYRDGDCSYEESRGGLGGLDGPTYWDVLFRVGGWFTTRLFTYLPYICTHISTTYGYFLGSEYSF